MCVLSTQKTRLHKAPWEGKPRERLERRGLGRNTNRPEIVINDSAGEGVRRKVSGGGGGGGEREKGGGDKEGSEDENQTPA